MSALLDSFVVLLLFLPECQQNFASLVHVIFWSAKTSSYYSLL